MNKSLVIMTIYPDAIPMVNYVVRDDSDGNGAYIDIWELPYPTPTDEELEVGWIKHLKKAKLEELNEACEQTIIDGFTATNGHTYQFDYKDQDNIGQQLTLLLLDPMIDSIQWKTKNAGIVVHTRAEFIALANDANNHKRSNMGKYWTLEAQIKTLTTESEINSIVW
jgi:hypothetical protein